MSFIYEHNENAGNIYAIDVRQRENHINWEAGNCSTMVICCPYEKYIFDSIEDFLDILSGVQFDAGQFTDVEYLDDVYGVMIVSIEERRRNRGCIIRDGAFSYIVLPVVEESGDIKVYAPRSDRQMRKQKIDIPIELEIQYAYEVLEQRRLLKTKEWQSGFIIIDTNLINLKSYRDGDIYIQLDNNIQVPLTNQMLKQEIYIKADQLPPIKSNNPGIKVTVKEATN